MTPDDFKPKAYIDASVESKIYKFKVGNLEVQNCWNVLRTRSSKGKSIRV